MVVRPKLRDETAEQLEKIKEQHEYGSLDRAIMHLLNNDENIVVAWDTAPTRAFTSWDKARFWMDHWETASYTLTEVIVDDMPPDYEGLEQ